MAKRRNAPRTPSDHHVKEEEDPDLIEPLTNDGGIGDQGENHELTWLQAVCTLLPSRQNYATQLRSRPGQSLKRQNPLYRAAFTLPSKAFRMDVHPHVLISLQRQLSTASLRTRGKSARLSRHSFRFLQKATGLGDGDAGNYINFASQMAAEEGMTDQEYLTTIRSLPVSMDEKRQVRAKLLQSPESVTGFSAWDQQQQKAKKRLKDLQREVIPFLYIWKQPMKIIEGQYGMGVVSYFVFLRWLLYLNLAIFWMVFFLIVLPQVIHNYHPQDTISTVTPGPQNLTTTMATPFVLKSDMLLNNSTGECSRTNDVCKCLYQEAIENKTQTGIKNLLDLLQGTGFMEDTALFAGWYSTTVHNVLPKFVKYNLALAYILVTLVYFLLCLMMMVVYTTDSVRESFKTADGHLHRYCNLVFGGWDYCIEEDEPAKRKHQNIMQELKSNLAEERRRAEIANWSRKMVLKVYMGRVLANFLVVCILAATLYAIYVVGDLALQLEFQGDNTTSDFKSLLVQFSPSLTLTAFNLLMPLIFGQIVKLENYAVDMEIKMTLIRTVFIRLASVVFLIATFYVKILCKPSERDPQCRFCDNKSNNKLYCWENYVGQQIYKLVILDFIVVVFTVFLMDFPRKLIAKHCSCKLSKLIGYQEFDIPKNVLDLVYSQTLCWLGTFYSPLLPAICVLKFFIFFYVKKLTLLVNYVPSNVPYRASRSNTFFVIVLMLSFVISAVPVGFAIAESTPSGGCSPFRSYDNMWDVVASSVRSIQNTVIKEILNFTVTAGFGVPLFVALCLAIYYYSTVTAANSQMVRVLKEQLVLEGKDKSFLLARLTEVTKLSRLPNK